MRDSIGEAERFPPSRLVAHEACGPTNQEVFMRKKIFALSLIAGTLLISACNTIQGAGEDVESAGHTVAKTADDAK
ncbi:MAG: entericidin A/B family lipoprotein [Sphingomonas sp.]